MIVPEAVSPTGAWAASGEDRDRSENDHARIIIKTRMTAAAAAIGKTRNERPRTVTTFFSGRKRPRASEGAVRSTTSCATGGGEVARTKVSAGDGAGGDIGASGVGGGGSRAGGASRSAANACHRLYTGRIGRSPPGRSKYARAVENSSSVA